MVRPLTGQREVFRRLGERNEARRVRTNEIREMGGLEPRPDPPTPDDIYQEFLSNYIGRPNTSYYQRALLEGLRSGNTHLIPGRSVGRSNVYDYASVVTENVLRGTQASHFYIDTEATLPHGRLDELYGYEEERDNWWDTFVDSSPTWQYLTGKITYEERVIQEKLTGLKKEKQITNDKAKFVLEKEY